MSIRRHNQAEVCAIPTSKRVDDVLRIGLCHRKSINASPTESTTLEYRILQSNDYIEVIRLLLSTSDSILHKRDTSRTPLLNVHAFIEVLRRLREHIESFGSVGNTFTTLFGESPLPDQSASEQEKLNWVQRMDDTLRPDLLSNQQASVPPFPQHQRAYGPGEERR